ncbi:efflux RND transporter periplasmic adaptor subunit [Shewanella sp. GXUN23E]|uniref:efflux RND transporter periplasmic adaptor subunit n=1 Tax=Shewanella sp. GXUN23E TaxID=3422498 RepID=UPI003D7E8E45
MADKRRVLLTVMMPLALLTLGGCNQAPQTRVVEGVLPQSIEVSGELESAGTVSMMPPAMRRVWQYQVKQLAPEGQPVTTGQVVARLDTSEIVQRLQVKQAELDATVQDIKTSKMRNAQKIEELKLELAQARMEYEKADLKYRLSDDTVAQIDKLKYQRDAEIASDRVVLVERKLTLERESIKQREAMLEGDRQKFAAEVSALESAIDAMTLKAPRPGMLVYGTDHEGNKIQEGQSIFAGGTVVSIADLDQMRVNMAIPEVEARRVKVGQTVSIRLDANPERRFRGKIIELGAVFRPKNQNVPLMVFDALASIEDPDPDLLRPGMTAKISIELPSHQQQMLLPSQAVHYEDGQAFVYVPSLFGDKRVDVTVGASANGLVAIVDGLSGEDEVSLP